MRPTISKAASFYSLSLQSRRRASKARRRASKAMRSEQANTLKLKQLTKEIGRSTADQWRGTEFGW